MVAQFQMRRDQDKTKADAGNQRHMTGMAPDRRREMRKAADDDSRERHDDSREWHAGDQQEIEQPPMDVSRLTNRLSPMGGAANNAGKDRVKLRVSSRATGTGGPNVARSMQNIKLFRPSAARSIDFGQFAPMFRFDAARYRNAIS